MITLALAQLNPKLGDLEGNAALIASAAQAAHAAGAKLLLTPELALTGYPPEDLLLREDFNQASEIALIELAKKTQGITLLVGHPRVFEGACYNAASVLQDGKIIATYHKQALPNHTVFDELRYFKAGSVPLVFEHQGVKCGVLICADIWEANPAKLAKQAGAEILLTLNASPYHMEKQDSRHEVARQRVLETGLALVYTNLVGGQDELVFDGASFVLDRSGAVVQQLPAFEEALSLVEIDSSAGNKGEDSGKAANGSESSGDKGKAPSAGTAVANDASGKKNSFAPTSLADLLKRIQIVAQQLAANRRGN